jgi:hypothetical protein
MEDYTKQKKSKQHPPAEQKKIKIKNTKVVIKFFKN